MGEPVAHEKAGRTKAGPPRAGLVGRPLPISKESYVTSRVEFATTNQSTGAVEPRRPKIKRAESKQNIQPKLVAKLNICPS